MKFLAGESKSAGVISTENEAIVDLIHGLITMAGVERHGSPLIVRYQVSFLEISSVRIAPKGCNLTEIALRVGESESR